MFQYKVVELKGVREDDEDMLDANGEQGWELVTIIVAPKVKPMKLMFLGYLKRPRE